MSDLGTLATVAGSILLIAAAIGVSIPYLRSKVTQATNEMLSTALEQTRRELAESEARCDRKIAQLEGQVRSMAPPFARVIAREVVKALRGEGMA